MNYALLETYLKDVLILEHEEHFSELGELLEEYKNLHGLGAMSNLIKTALSMKEK